MALADRAVALGGDAEENRSHAEFDSRCLRLLDVTRQTERGTIPVISMAMGEMGRIASRIAGGLFGSATFAAGINASAPGKWTLNRCVRRCKASIRPRIGQGKL